MPPSSLAAPTFPLTPRLLCLGTALLLAGCSGWNLPGAGRTLSVETPVYEGLGDSDHALTRREQLLAKSDFSMEVVRLSDQRRPRSTAMEPTDRNIYEYEPEQLVSGITYRMPVLFNKFLAYHPRVPKHYGVELDLLQLKTIIGNGTFWTGSFGRYLVTLEVTALARRPDSTVALRKTYLIKLEQPRRASDGRSPTKEMDRAQMYDMVEDAVRRASEEMAWDIRQMDARRWRVRAEAPAPRRLERVIPAPRPDEAAPPAGVPGGPAYLPLVPSPTPTDASGTVLPPLLQPVVLPPNSVREPGMMPSGDGTPDDENGGEGTPTFMAPEGEHVQMVPGTTTVDIEGRS